MASKTNLGAIYYWEIKKSEWSVVRFEPFVPQALSRKKVAATVSRRECVYKRTGEPSGRFCDQGGITQCYD